MHKNGLVKRPGRLYLHIIKDENDQARSTLPDFRQLVHTWSVLTVPFTFALTVRIFGFQALFDLLCEWLTLFPNRSPFPQISHFAMIRNLLHSSSCVNYDIYVRISHYTEPAEEISLNRTYSLKTQQWYCIKNRARMQV